jgi:pilus assembly protein CpaC
MNRPARPSSLSKPLKTALAHLTGLALISGALAVHAGAARAAGAPWRDLAGAPSAAAAPDGGRVVNIDVGGGASRSLSLPRGKSATIELPVDARDVLVSDPQTADVVLSSPRRIYVLGKKSGATDAVFVDGMGHQILRLNVRVEQDVSAITETLNRILPGSAVHVEAINNNLVLTGEVPDAASADKAIRIAASYTDKPENVLNMLAVAGPEQVMLKVRIVEVNRNVIKQLGVNLNAFFSRVGQSATNAATATTAMPFGANGALLGGLSGAYAYLNKGTGVESAIGAFEQAGLIRTLAEPNLTTVSGEAAKFLAGGEFPVPVDEDNLGRVTVEFKNFGVGLGFTPVVLSSGRISLKLSTEYSELTNVGALSVSTGTSSTNTGVSSGSNGAGGGITGGTGSNGSTGGSTTASTGSTLSIPGLTVRRAETMVELPSGGSMMIAGLLESVTKQTISSLPGLTQLPVLGALFRSRDFQEGETELVVIVTPYLVKPSRPDQMQTPADGLQFADDASSYLLGQLNKSMGTGGASSPPPAQTYQGPFGYVVQ